MAPLCTIRCRYPPRRLVASSRGILLDGISQSGIFASRRVLMRHRRLVCGQPALSLWIYSCAFGADIFTWSFIVLMKNNPIPANALKSCSGGYIKCTIEYYLDLFHLGDDPDAMEHERSAGCGVLPRATPPNWKHFSSENFELSDRHRLFTLARAF
jgi:hypothetical protein